MIYEVVNTWDLLLRDAAAGVDYEVDTANTAKGTTTYRPREILTWDLKKLPSEMEMPTVQLVYERGFNWQVKSQLKWRGDHALSLIYWTDEKAADQARKDIAIMAHVFRKLVDKVTDYAGSTIDSVTDQSVFVVGWPLAGRLITYMQYSFVCHERDENP